MGDDRGNTWRGMETFFMSSEIPTVSPKSSESHSLGQWGGMVAKQVEKSSLAFFLPGAVGVGKPLGPGP